MNQDTMKLAANMMIGDLEVENDVFLECYDGEYFAFIPYYAHGRQNHHKLPLSDLIKSAHSAFVQTGVIKKN